MKKATKMLAWLLLAAMPVAGAAETNVIERPAASVGMERLERYPSHEMDAETGKWTVRSNPAEALLDRDTLNRQEFEMLMRGEELPPKTEAEQVQPFDDNADTLPFEAVTVPEEKEEAFTEPDGDDQ